ncbi:hypothetical protein ES703_09083 [subsurface metagenome]
MKEDGREYGSKRVTDSEVISSVPCDLLQIIVTHTTGTAQFKVYDGVNDEGELKLDLKAQYSHSFNFPGGMHMKQGIYFYRDTKVQSATIRWRVTPRDRA